MLRYASDGSTFVSYDDDGGVVTIKSFGGVGAKEVSMDWVKRAMSSDYLKNFKPIHIIYNNPATICYFADGDKIVVKCSEGERYVPEYGVMACVVKKIYGSRAKFLKTVNNGHNQKENPFIK
jgi:hypothetical protein